MNNHTMKQIACIGSQQVLKTVQFRVKPGASLPTAIEEAVAAEKIEAGVIVSGLGALEKAVFRNLKHFPSEFPVKHDVRQIKINQWEKNFSSSGAVRMTNTTRKK